VTQSATARAALHGRTLVTPTSPSTTVVTTSTTGGGGATGTSVTTVLP
jgi:hypothetical protein